MKPFALSSANQFGPPPPAPFGSAEFIRQTQQIIDYSANLTDEQKVVAEYWAEGPNSELPPGHWCLFADLVSKRDGHDLDQDVKMLFALSTAELDAGIAVWDAKRAYDYTRPITAVHRFRGSNGPGMRRTVQGHATNASGRLATVLAAKRRNANRFRNTSLGTAPSAQQCRHSKGFHWK